VKGRPCLLLQVVDNLVVVRLGRTMVVALGSCRIDRLVEDSWYRIHVDFGMRGRILLSAVYSGATV
jgi:hypothetical protein